MCFSKYVLKSAQCCDIGDTLYVECRFWCSKIRSGCTTYNRYKCCNYRPNSSFTCQFAFRIIPLDSIGNMTYMDVWNTLDHITDSVMSHHSSPLIALITSPNLILQSGVPPSADKRQRFHPICNMETFAIGWLTRTYCYYVSYIILIQNDNNPRRLHGCCIVPLFPVIF